MTARVDIELECCTLADLMDACQVIQNECNAAEDRRVDPSEILICSREFNRIWIAVHSNTLTDGSTVYDAEVR